MVQDYYKLLKIPYDASDEIIHSKCADVVNYYSSQGNSEDVRKKIQQIRSLEKLMTNPAKRAEYNKKLGIGAYKNNNDTNTIFCRMCGAKIGHNSVFCKKCGSNLKEESNNRVNYNTGDSGQNIYNKSENNDFLSNCLNFSFLELPNLVIAWVVFNLMLITISYTLMSINIFLAIFLFVCGFLIFNNVLLKVYKFSMKFKK